ncbi:arylsulfatase regulator [uncultured Methylophaga sp.]|uniref:arylsulfatase regulator n=1 Tax=uncultured Methylophaga sp. TaxID=285271 RepID=UPI00259C8D7D|nr:arylsulfatase regulator [uncultured Methylophaga sp.]
MPAMNLTAEQRQLVLLIDNHVGRFPETPLGDEQLLVTVYDYMEAFKMLMDSTTTVQIDYLSQHFPGFYRYAKLLESLAQGIADGVIDVPADH